MYSCWEKGKTYVDFVEDMAVNGNLAVAADPWNCMAVGSTDIVVDIKIIVASVANFL